MFEYDASNIDPKEVEGPVFDPIPEGDYQLQIIESEEGISKKENPLVRLKCEVQCGVDINDKEYFGKFVWHNVTFLPEGKKGRGMAIKFLKTIGEPFEGEFQVNAENWKGKMFDAHIVTETYLGVARNKIGYLKDKAEEESIPF